MTECIMAIDPGPEESGVSEKRREQLRAANRRYKRKNRDRLNQKQRERRANNLDKEAARMREYRARKPEVIAAIEKRRNRPEGYRDKFNKYRSQWAKNNPEKLREYAHKRNGKRFPSHDPQEDNGIM